MLKPDVDAPVVTAIPLKIKVKIEAITNDLNAKAEVIGPQKLVVGENEFKIVVTSEKGEKATYTVVINNLDKNISKMLKSLSIKGYSIICIA